MDTFHELLIAVGNGKIANKLKFQRDKKIDDDEKGIEQIVREVIVLKQDGASGQRPTISSKFSMHKSTNKSSKDLHFSSKDLDQSDDAETSIKFKHFMKPHRYVFVESEHSTKFPPESVGFAEVAIPGASMLAVFFDEKTKMRKGDHITFLVDAAGSGFYGDVQKHCKLESGDLSEGFPMISTSNPLLLPKCDGRVVVKWKTGKQNDAAFGFRLIVFDAAILDSKLIDRKSQSAGTLRVFSKLIEGVFYPGVMGANPEFVKTVAKLYRSFAYTVPKDMFEVARKKRRTAASIAAAALDSQGEEELDSYDGEEQLLTLKNTQLALYQIHAVPLACFLMSQTGAYDAQLEGVSLGMFMLKELNQESQKLFVQTALGSASHYRHIGVKYFTELARLLSNFDDEIGGRNGAERRQRLLEMKEVLAFLQNLCEGQYKEAQGLLALRQEFCGKNILEIIMEVVRSVYLAVTTGGLSEEDVSNFVDIVQQAFDTLNDAIQGPNMTNIDILLRSAVVSSIVDWISLIDRLRIKWLEENAVILPNLETSIFSPQYLSLLCSTRQEFEFEEFIAFFNITNEVESSALALLASVMEEAPTSDSVEADDDAAADEADGVGNAGAVGDSNNLTDLGRLNIILQELEPGVDLLINRFKVCWASVLFDGKASVQAYLKGLSKHKKKAMQMQKQQLNRSLWTRLMRCLGYETVTEGDDATPHVSFKKQLSRIKNILNDNTNMSFRPEGLVPYLTEEQRKIYMRLWLMQYGHVEAQQEIQLAFNFYLLLTELSDKVKSSAFALYPDDTKDQLQGICKKWLSRDESAAISTDEAFAFDNYFVSVEVILGGKVKRVHFPIPRECRNQAKNPLVLHEMEQLVMEVNRDSPEGKLANFLDLSNKVAAVIEQQDALLTKSRFKLLLKLLITNEWYWVVITFALTLYINLTMLMYGSQVQSEFDPTAAYYGMPNSTATDPGFVLGDQFLDPVQLGHIQYVGYAHLSMSCIFLLNFMLGTTRINVVNGFKWKSEVVNDQIALPIDSVAISMVFKIVNDITPKILWYIAFILGDVKMLYYMMFVVFSALGCFYHVAFFSFHVLDIAMRIPILGYVLQSVFENIDQVAVTFFFGAVLTWIYAIVGIYCFGFNSYNFGEAYVPATIRDIFYEHLGEC